MLFFMVAEEKSRSLPINTTPLFLLYYNINSPDSTYPLRNLSLIPKSAAVYRAYCTQMQAFDTKNHIFSLWDNRKERVS